METIWIRKSNNIKQDEGNYQLSHVWDKLLLTDVINWKLALMKTSDQPQFDKWHTHTHLFNGLFSGTTRVSQYQKGKTNLDFTETREVSGSG